MMDNGRDRARRSPEPRAILVVMALALLALALFTVTACVPVEPVAPASATEHPVVQPGQSCVSCKASDHVVDYPHQEPFGGGQCQDCHVTSSWSRVFHTHATEDMNLGFHITVGCTYCHTIERPVPEADCRTCHEPKHAETLPCTNCHMALSWRIHKALPEGHVSVAGAHAAFDCFECHEGQKAFVEPKQCAECHGVNHGGLTECGECHDPSLGWLPKDDFDHDGFFVLAGAHERLNCTKCHPDGRFAGTPTRCVGCHGAKHGGLTDCARCHTTATFIPATFNHSSRFSLSGAHSRLSCTSCHPKGYASNIRRSPGCAGCHGAQHGGLTDCAGCHTTKSFKPATFKHSSVFALTGAHTRVACSSCHPESRYATNIRRGTGCTGCHGTQHGGLTACADCHTTSGFKPATFDHTSAFQLTGAHVSVPCTSCHPNGYTTAKGDPGKCSNCHGTKHGITTDCGQCHTTTSFIPAKRITHPVAPALGGEHANRSCGLCHSNLVFSAPTRQCSGCHTAPHVAPTDCLRCHRPTVWSEVHFEHDLIGYHTQLPFEEACLSCHTTGNYSQYRCDGCHLPY